MNNLREEKYKNLKLFKETKNKLLEKQEESKIFSQAYILYGISDVLKQTFVNELEKFTNGTKDLPLSLRKLKGPLAKLFSNKISVTFLVKSKINK